MRSWWSQIGVFSAAMYAVSLGDRAASEAAAAAASAQDEPPQDKVMTAGVMFQPRVLTEATRQVDEFEINPLADNNPLAPQTAPLSNTAVGDDMNRGVRSTGKTDPDAFFAKLSERLDGDNASGANATP